jgi:uncharacterized protein
MPEMNSYPPGTPAWVDLRTTDVEDARRFYSGLFGWTIDPPTPEHHDSTAGMVQGRMVAGMGPLEDDREPPAWMTYVAVDDADGVARRATENGAAFVQPVTDVPRAGKVGSFRDPTGATLGIWQAIDHGYAEIVNEPNTLCWNELATRDIDAARDFYRAVFGWGVRTNPFEGTVYTEWKVGDHSVGGMIQMTDEWPDDVPAHWMTYFAVDDCDARTDHAEELGGKVLDPPTDIPPGRFAVLSDPQGAVFSILEMADE